MGFLAVEWTIGGDAGEGERAVEEAVSAGMRSMEELVELLSQNPNRKEEERTCMRVADAAVAKFKKVISLLDRSRTGHARFRRSPVVGRADEGKKVVVPATEEKRLDEVVPVKIYCPKPIQRLPPLPHHLSHQHPTRVFAAAAANSSLTGSITSSSAFQVMPTPASAATGRVPLPPGSSAVSLPLKRKCVIGDENGGSVTGGKCLSGPTVGRCHCSNTKKRKFRVRRTVRVPAISVKSSDIPSDEFSWRKYGQKPIKGSPYPRIHGFESCSDQPLSWSDGRAFEQGILQVQQRQRLSGEETRRASGGRPIDAHRHLRRRPQSRQPLPHPHPDRRLRPCSHTADRHLLTFFITTTAGVASTLHLRPEPTNHPTKVLASKQQLHPPP